MSYVRLVALLVYSCTLIACATVDATEARKMAAAFSERGNYPAPDAPLDLCAGQVTHQNSVAIPALPKPEFMSPYKDPAFNGKIIRITESKFNDVHKPMYNTIQAWNADESLLLLFRKKNGGSDHVLLDGHTYKQLGRLDIFPADLEEIFWSRHNPDILFYASQSPSRIGRFYAYNVRSEKHTLLKDFRSQCSGGVTSSTDVHMQSLDDDLFGFRCEAPNGGWHLMSYRISSDELSVVVAGDSNPWDNWRAPMAAASGDRMWMQGRVVSPDLQTIEHTLDMSQPGEHASIGLTHNGQDAIFPTVFDPSPGGCDGTPDLGVGHLAVHNFMDGTCRSMITQAEGWPYTTSGTHVTAGAYKQPGWVAVSSVGYPKQLPFYTNGEAATPLFSEIFLVNTNPANEQVCRLTHHRSYGKHATKGDYKAYFGEPHPSISPSGTRIVFGSDWQNSGAVDAYVIELPAYQAPPQ